MFGNYTGDYRNLRTDPLFLEHNMLKANQIYYFKPLQLIHRNNYYPTLEDEQSPVNNMWHPKR